MTDKEKLNKIQHLLNMPMFKSICKIHPRLDQWRMGLQEILTPSTQHILTV